jgi:hypothetical protein
VTLWALDENEKLCLDILALLPRENIVYFETNLSMAVMKEMVAVMPSLEVLCLIEMATSGRFLLPNPDGPNTHMKLLPSVMVVFARCGRGVLS